MFLIYMGFFYFYDLCNVLFEFVVKYGVLNDGLGEDVYLRLLNLFINYLFVYFFYYGYFGLCDEEKV